MTVNKLITLWKTHQFTASLILGETSSVRDVQNKPKIKTQLQRVYDYKSVRSWAKERRVWQTNDRGRCSELKDANL